METKTIIFNGAGLDMDLHDSQLSNVGNYRIRTVFRNLEGRTFFLELSSGWIYDKSNKNRIKAWIHIDHLFRADVEEDVFNNYSKDLYYLENKFNIDKIEYTKENIINFINEYFNCDFTDLKVVKWYDYSTNSKNGYIVMNDIVLNEKKSKAIENTFSVIDKEFREKYQSKYSCCSIIEVLENHIIVRIHKENRNVERELIYI